MKPKLKEYFRSGKIIKWIDFCGQEVRKKKENSILSVHDSRGEVVEGWNKPTSLNVYSKNYTRKNKGDKTITHNSQSMQKDEDALIGVSEGSDGGEGIKGSSSSEDDNSSEEFNITSDIDTEAEKEIQEEAALEGVRCLLGEETQEMEGMKRKEEVQVLNQYNHNGSSFHQSGGEGGRFLDALNIKLITTDREHRCDKRDEGPSFTKRSRVRELHNLVCNVNYEKGLRCKRKISHQ